MTEAAVQKQPDERATGRKEEPLRPFAPVLRLARMALLRRLRHLDRGVVTLVEGTERHTFGRISAECPIQATVTIHDPRTYAYLMLGGTVGAGDAYRWGLWNADDLTALVRIFVLNRALLDGMERGLAGLAGSVLKLLHRLRRNTKTGSRHNIEAHYDLGNDLFKLMLDETMMYSCAYFERPDATLAEASRAKNDLICRKIECSPHDHILEIGAGWGGFAVHAASRYGCRVTTTTISRQQYDYAVRRVKEAGLGDRVRVLLADYRDLPGLRERFDKLVSIEMIEAVGYEYYETFFRVCGRLLKPEGRLLIQGITIDERLYGRAIHSVDFIQRFIFPGSCIPAVGALIQASAKGSDLGLIHLEDIGAHYPPTLRAWRHNLLSHVRELWQTGITPEFLRLWEFYLCYCEGGFLERAISTVHLLFCKSDWRPQPVGC